MTSRSIRRQRDAVANWVRERELWRQRRLDAAIQESVTIQPMIMLKDDHPEGWCCICDPDSTCLDNAMRCRPGDFETVEH